MIKQVLLFLLQSGGLLATWQLATDHNKRDFVFLVLGLMLACQNAAYFGSVVIVQMRHFFALMIIIAIILRANLLRSNLGMMSKVYIVLVLLIYVASAWSLHPKDFFIIKFHRTVYAVLMVLLAGTFRDESDIRKFLWMLFPNLVLLAVGLAFGSQELVDVSDRLMINEQNANSVGAFSGYLVFGGALILVFLKTNIVVKIVLGICVLSGISTLLGSGSRTAFASCAGAVLVSSVALMTSRKRFFLVGIPLFMILAYGIARVWRTISYSITERLMMIASGGTSGRDIVWGLGLEYLRKEHLWQGMGGIMQGFFIQRSEWLAENTIKWGSTLNIYIDTILETGIMGLILWLLLLVMFIVRSCRLWRGQKSSCKYVPIAMCMFGLLQGVGEAVSMKAEMPFGMFMIIGLVILSAKRFQWGGQSFGRTFHMRQDMPYGYSAF